MSKDEAFKMRSKGGKNAWKGVPAKVRAERMRALALARWGKRKK